MSLKSIAPYLLLGFTFIFISYCFIKVFLTDKETNNTKHLEDIVFGTLLIIFFVSFRRLLRALK
jgi:H+/Cl- antiporter ClcA